MMMGYARERMMMMDMNKRPVVTRSKREQQTKDDDDEMEMVETQMDGMDVPTTQQPAASNYKRWSGRTS